MIVTKKQLWQWQSGETDELPPELLDFLTRQDVRQVVADWQMSENHVGGDDVVDAVELSLQAVKDGYEVVVWYGPHAEVLVLGIRPGSMTVIEPEVEDDVEDPDDEH